MKTENAVRVLLAAILLAVFSGCATYPHSGQKALVGVWTNSLGTVWTIKADGTFSVDLNRDGKPDAWGRYVVAHDTVRIFDARGHVPKACKGEGVYRFQRSERMLHFTLVKDTCKLRVKNVLLDWRKQ